MPMARIFSIPPTCSTICITAFTDSSTYCSTRWNVWVLIEVVAIISPSPSTMPKTELVPPKSKPITKDFTSYSILLLINRLKSKNNEERYKLLFIKFFINAQFVTKIFYFAKLLVLSNTTIKIALIFLKRKHFLYFEPSYGRNTCTSLASDAD